MCVKYLIVKSDYVRSQLNKGVINRKIYNFFKNNDRVNIIYQFSLSNEQIVKLLVNKLSMLNASVSLIPRPDYKPQEIPALVVKDLSIYRTPSFFMFNDFHFKNLSDEKLIILGEFKNLKQYDKKEELIYKFNTTLLTMKTVIDQHLLDPNFNSLSSQLYALHSVLSSLSGESAEFVNYSVIPVDEEHITYKLNKITWLVLEDLQMSFKLFKFYDEEIHKLKRNFLENTSQLNLNTLVKKQDELRMEMNKLKTKISTYLINQIPKKP